MNKVLEFLISSLTVGNSRSGRMYARNLTRPVFNPSNHKKKTFKGCPRETLTQFACLYIFALVGIQL